MKEKFALAMLLLISGAATAHNYAPKAYTLPTTYVQAPHEHVQGYTRANGTSVQPYERTVADTTQANNWSSKPNVNPYTGKEGTKDPYATSYGH